MVIAAVFQLPVIIMKFSARTSQLFQLLATIILSPGEPVPNILACQSWGTITRLEHRVAIKFVAADFSRNLLLFTLGRPDTKPVAPLRISFATT